MIEGNGTAYAQLTKKYVKGKIPFRVWILSALAGALSVVLDNAVRHEAILQGFFSIFFLNMAITIPMFLAQAHYVGMALQKKPKTAKTVLWMVLLIGWVVTSLVIVYFLNKIYYQGMNSGAMLMIADFAAVLVTWILLSLVMFRVHKFKAS